MRVQGGGGSGSGAGCLLLTENKCSHPAMLVVVTESPLLTVTEDDNNPGY